MKKESRLILIIVLFIIAIFFIWIITNSALKCLPEGAPVYYCETNPTETLKWYECKNKIAEEFIKTCPKFYEEKTIYYINNKKVSFTEFENFIKERNQSCNGCIQRVVVPVI